MRPIKYWTIIAIAGPKTEVAATAKSLRADGKFTKVLSFFTPDDHGSFPDTQGYEAENFAELESDCEDPALYKYMTKCMDACLEYVNKKFKWADERFNGEIEKNLNWPKVGGKLFFVTGHVTVYPGNIITMGNA